MATHLEWPFFDERHRALAASASTWATANLAATKDAWPRTIAFLRKQPNK